MIPIVDASAIPSDAAIPDAAYQALLADAVTAYTSAFAVPVPTADACMVRLLDVDAYTAPVTAAELVVHYLQATEALLSEQFGDQPDLGEALVQLAQSTALQLIDNWAGQVEATSATASLNGPIDGIGFVAHSLCTASTNGVLPPGVVALAYIFTVVPA